jgi:hypothetical protein
MKNICFKLLFQHLDVFFGQCILLEQDIWDVSNAANVHGIKRYYLMIMINSGKKQSVKFCFFCIQLDIVCYNLIRKVDEKNGI